VTVYTVTMLLTLLSILQRKKNIISLLIMSFVIFTLLRVIPVYKVLRNSLRISNLSIGRKFELFYEYIFGSFMLSSSGEQFLIIILAILTALNIILFTIYAQRQKSILSGRSFVASISGMVLGLFGVGCLSCGVLILAPLITFLGLGAYASGFVEYAFLLASIGVLFVLISNCYLIKKISEPLICLSK
jgi:hypothetical protein